MKLLGLSPKRQHGHVLATILVATAIVGIALASYLKLTQSQNIFTARSQIWNTCIPLLEAGVEEALAQLNMSSNANLVANGWTGTSTLFTKERALGDGYYHAQVTFTNALRPSIVVTGYLPAPSALALRSVPYMFAATLAKPGVKYISRSVRVTVMKEPAFAKGMVCKDKIDLGGNHCLFDSFDSAVGPYTAATAGDKGDVATNADIDNAVGIGNADIKGHLSTGPKATVNVGPNGRVGSVAWHLNPAGRGKIEPGWWRRDMNQSIPDVVPPFTTGVAPNSQGSWKYVFDGGQFYLNQLSVSGGEKIHITAPSILYVKGNVNISGNLKVSDGASIKIYVDGTSVNLSGTYDKQDIASELMIFGTPSVKEVGVNGVAAVIYAPSAKLSLNGNANFYGASVTKEARMNGTTGFHYDFALSRLSEYKQYIITSWNEI